jgi:hypothetical protein
MTVVMVLHDGTVRVVGRFNARTADLAMVDTLARLQLVARRCGCLIRLRDVPEGLRELLELAGLAGVLGLETRREAELGEEGGVEEVVQPRDPAG